MIKAFLNTSQKTTDFQSNNEISLIPRAIFGCILSILIVAILSEHCQNIFIELIYT